MRGGYLITGISLASENATYDNDQAPFRCLLIKYRALRNKWSAGYVYTKERPRLTPITTETNHINHPAGQDTMSLSKPKILNFVTGNMRKLAEAKGILGDTVILTSQAIDIPEIQGSLEEIARDKCQKAANAV
ncbi:nucleoside triphosphate pyrophosphohydrolase ham1 [Microsporum audouinii]